MNLRALTLAAALLLPAAISAYARIIVDENAPEQAAEPNINVSSPADTAGAKDANAVDTLTFLNQDRLHGTLLGIDGTNGVRWQDPYAHDPIVFNLDQLA